MSKEKTRVLLGGRADGRGSLQLFRRGDHPEMFLDPECKMPFARSDLHHEISRNVAEEEDVIREIRGEPKVPFLLAPRDCFLAGDFIIELERKDDIPPQSVSDQFHTEVGKSNAQELVPPQSLSATFASKLGLSSGTIWLLIVIGIGAVVFFIIVLLGG